MKKLILFIAILFSIVAKAQVQRYDSYERIYTTKDSTFQVVDSSKIMLYESTMGKKLLIVNEEYIFTVILQDLKEHKYNKDGSYSIVYKTKRFGIVTWVEFFYRNEILNYISITQENSFIMTYYIIPKRFIT